MRRSRRLSGYGGEGSGATTSSSARQSIATDATSPGALPTIAHARARAAKAAEVRDRGYGATRRDNGSDRRERIERRFEDFLDEDTDAPMASTSTGELSTTSSFREAAGSGRWSQAASLRRNVEEDKTSRGTARRDASGTRHHNQGGAESPRGSRKPRKTFNEQVDDSGFIFTSERARNPSLSSAIPEQRSVLGSMHSPPRATYQTKYELLADMDIGETPVHRKNRSFRAQAGADRGDSDTTPRGQAITSARRTSIGTKSSRRISSLTSGAPAYPHPRVPDKEMYRHCSNDIDDVGRMRHLTSWALKRGLEATLRGETRKSRRGESQKYLSPRELKEVERCKAPMRAAMAATLDSLNEGLVDIDWLSRKKISTFAQKEAHPRNVANISSSERLSSQLEDLTREMEIWREEDAQMNAYEEETEHLIEETHSSLTEADPGESIPLKRVAEPTQMLKWSRADMSEHQLKQIEDARRLLAYEAQWTADGEGKGIGYTAMRAASVLCEFETLREQSRRREGEQRASQDDASKRDALVAEAHLGIELDARWNNVEVHADLLRSQTHRLSQLSALADRYLSEVSVRATQTLRGLTNGFDEPASSSVTSVSSASRRQVGSQRAIASRLARESRDNVESILRRMRGLSRGESDGIGQFGGVDTERRDADPEGDGSEGNLLRALADS